MKKFLLPAMALLASLLTAQAQTFSSSNLIVLRLSGYDTTTGDGATVNMDQYTTNGTLVNTVAIPSSGATSLIMNGEPYEGYITQTPDDLHLVFAGYHSGLGVQELLNSASSTVPRVIGTLDAYGNYAMPISNMTNFNSSSINGAASDGTNYWAIGTGPNTTPYLYNQAVYFGTATAGSTNQVINNLAGSGMHNITLYNNALYVTGYTTNAGISANGFGSGGFMLSNISGSLPTNETGWTNVLPTGTSAASTSSDLVINSAGTIAYVADNSFGVVKFTNNGAGWISNYTILLTNTGYTIAASGHAISVTADFTQSPTVVYATTAETITNRLVTFVDSNALPIVVNLATNLVGNPTNTFRGVRFAPLAYGYVSVPPVAFSGNPGGTATFSATVLGIPAPTVQWYSNSVANPTWVLIPGATTTTLTLPGLTLAQSGSLFYIQASNIYGSSSNTPVSLTVNNPSINTQPVGATNFPGGPCANLFVYASGTGTLSYQWLSNGIAISGATMSNYMVCVTGSNTATYSVIVTNTGPGVTSITSAPTVVAYTPYLLQDTFTYPNGNIFGDAGSPWTEESGSNPINVTNDTVQISQTIGSLGTAFGQSLYSQTVPENSTVLWASFIVNLKTLPTAVGGSYLAYFQSTNFNFYGRVIAVTSNNPAYTPDLPPSAFPGTYRLGISGDSSTATAVAELDMAPGIDYEVVIYYDQVNGYCQLAINPSQANYNQVYAPFATPSPLASAITADTFTQSALPMAAFGLRQATGCGIIDLHNLEVSYDWNGAGTGFAAVMAGITAAKPVVGFISPGITNYSGNSNVMEVAASGIGLSYAWYQGTNGVIGSTNALSDGGSLTGSATYALTLNPEVGTNTGNYFCVVSNSVGATTSSVVVVSINATPTAPMFTLQPVSTTASLGANVTFTANAVGTGPISYAWNTGGVPNGSVGPTFTLTRVQTNMSGNAYSVTATGGAAPPTTSTNAILTVNGPVVTNIAFLRSLQVTNAAPTITVPASNSTTVYQVSGYVLTYTNIESASYTEYWIEDGTGGIEFFVATPLIPTFMPKFGDLVAVSGVVDIFDDAVEFDGSAANPAEPYTITSTNGEGMPFPYPAELIPFGFATANPGLSSLTYQGKLGVFTNCYFATPGATFAGDATYTVSNLAGQTYELFIGQSSGPDLIGQTVPAFAYSISGAYDQFDANYELNLSAGVEIVTAPPPPVTDLKATASGTGVTLKWTAIPASYTYSVKSSTNVAGPYTNLAPGLWFSNTSGTYIDVAPGSETKFYEIVSP